VSRFVTLTKGSSDFYPYLLGTFSKTERALPVQTLNVNSASETVTFKIVKCSEVVKPSPIVMFFRTLKMRSLLLVLFPLLLVLTKNVVDLTIRDPLAALIATMGVVFAYVAMSLRNDFMDHMKGVDRVIERSGSRAIQNGWMTAAQVKTLSNVFLGLSLLMSVPVALGYPQVLIVLVIALLVGLRAQFNKRSSFKYRIGGEISLFLMFGPLLSIGYQYAMGTWLDLEVVMLGCLWGWLVLFVVHVKNFTNIMVSSQAGFRNTVNWLGFDRSKTLLGVWWIVFMILNFMYHLEFAGMYWGWYLTIVLLFCSANFFYRLKNITSPVGSDLALILRSSMNLFMITMGLWVIECLWYLST
jgi:1,4-dihydroxy-2-naphthoate octaprenyltransferase